MSLNVSQPVIVESVPRFRSSKKYEIKNANHGNGIKVAIDIAYKGTN